MENVLYDLTNPQKSIWLTEQYYSGTPVNNIGGTVIIKQKVNFELLKKAIYEYVKTNDSFLTKLCFDKDGNIHQYIDNFTNFDIDYLSFDSIDDLSNFEKKDCDRNFNMLDSSLFRFTIFELPNNNGGFVITVHHLISDAQTVTQIASKVMYFYSCFSDNKVPDILPTSYIDYINSEKNYLNSSKFIKDKDYWETLFETTPSVASLSTKSQSTTNSCVSDRKCFTIDNSKMNKINDYCKNNNISCFNFFMSIISLYISKVTNEKRFVIGTPILNRTNFKEKNTAGMFISTVPFLINLEENTSFYNFAHSISEQSFTAFRHQKYPYQSTLEFVRTKEASLPNLYNIMISYQINKTDANACDVPYTTNWTHSTYNVDELDIHLFDINDTGNLNIAYDYQLSKYSDNDIILLHKRILFIINQIIENPNLLTNEVDLVLPEEKNFILRNYNNAIDIPITHTVIDLFEQQVLKVPNNVAISFEDQIFTYAQLNNAVNYFSSYLLDNNVKQGDKVCLFFSNSIELIISILSILKLGACYIPIDVSYPIERIKYIVQDSNCSKILTNNEQINKISDLKSKAIIIDLHTINQASQENIYDNIHKPSLSDSAYIIYTSGSTGNPKGVEISHESLSNYIIWANQKYVNGEITNFPLYSSISFDLTVTSIFTPLISGNGIYIYNNSNPQLLLKEIIDDKKVQIIKLTPAHLILLQDIDLENSVVTKLIVGGDSLTNEICKKISTHFSHPIHIYNEYGPTEATVGCMIYEYNEDSQNYATVPIGIPANNTNLFVLNNDYNLIPFGYNGQLYIAGKCLSKGYVNLSHITNSKFVMCPFLQDKKMYQSGDIVKLYSNGIMEYIGRSDFQIKINGFRIEIGEIQSQISNYANIKNCYVCTIDINGVKTLCAYYVSDGLVDSNELKTYLHKSLPIYMVPKYFVELDEIPLTTNGKVNKALLPTPTVTEASTYIAPESNLEKILHNIFCELLQIQKISVTSNFFDFGIDSLSIIKIQTKLYSMGHIINTQDFYEFSSIRKLAIHMSENSNKTNNIIYKDFPDLHNVLKPVNLENKLNNILLLGTTGFLGIHLLHELLTQTKCNIYCIIRTKDGLAPWQRLHKKFNFYFPNENILDYTNRIIILNGSILKDKFGLADDEYSSIGKTIDCVLDSAALVKHYGNYDDFANTNVKGTQKVVDFCTNFNVPLHYISTISVSGYGLVKNPNITFTENDFYIGQNYEDNVYVKSKFEAEKIIFNTCKYSNLIATIYRIGNITNRFSDCTFQENASQNAYFNRLTSIINLKCAPTELLHTALEFTPVDCCASFIVTLLSKKKKLENITVYHLFNDNYVDFSKLLNCLTNLGFSMKICNMKDFEAQLLKHESNYFGIISYMANITQNNFNQVTLDNTYTNSILKEFNLSWPQITDTYLNNLINYLIKNKFIGDVK